MSKQFILSFATYACIFAFVALLLAGLYVSVSQYRHRSRSAGLPWPPKIGLRASLEHLRLPNQTAEVRP